MKKRLIAALALAGLLLTTAASAEITAAAPAATAAEAASFESVTQYRNFVNPKYAVPYTREHKVSYYDNVYAYNHGEYGLTPFDAKLPAEYLVMDESGTLAVAPIVLDITDAMRTRLYGGDIGETAMLYGQYCERLRTKKGDSGFTGIHEGIDFVNDRGCPLYAILDGVVTRAGDSNGTVGIYNEQYDVTLLYLHCQDIDVRRGDVIEAGDLIACEGRKKSGLPYTHVEMRKGRHTSSSPYTNTLLESDCPYAVMQEALGVVASGRAPVTSAAVMQAKRMREEAEAAAQKQAEEEAARLAEQNKEPEIELVETLPGTNAGYGFSAQEEATASPAPEATLPPSNP